jgi:hypothetical protein
VDWEKLANVRQQQTTRADMRANDLEYELVVAREKIVELEKAIEEKEKGKKAP